MKKQTISFAVNCSSGQITSVGRATLLQPKINYTGKGTKWFDDNKLLRKKH